MYPILLQYQLINKLHIFAVDTKDAGVGELEVVCEAMGERRVRMPVDIREDGHIHRVRLRPSVPAHYRIYISYGGKKKFSTLSTIRASHIGSKGPPALRFLLTLLARFHIYSLKDF